MRTWWYAICLTALVVAPLASAQEKQAFDETYDFRFTSVRAPTTSSTSGTNCLYIEGETHLLTLRATATWDPQSPFTESLEIFFVDFWGDRHDPIRVSGPSSLTFETGNVTLGPEDLLFVAVQLPGHGVALDQSVVFDLHIEHIGDALEIGTGSCTFA